MIKIPAVRSKSEIAGPSLCPIPLAVVIARCCCPVEGEANDNFSGLGQTGWSSRKTESRLKAGNATLGMSRLHWIEKIVGLRLIISYWNKVGHSRKSKHTKFDPKVTK